MNPSSSMRSDLRKRLALMVTIAGLVAVTVAICLIPHAPSLPRKLVLSIQNGEFVVPENAPDRRVPANTPIEVTFRSLDYVYAVEHDTDGQTVIILPNSEAHLNVTLRKGRSAVEIVQGCGRLFGEHRRSVILRAGL